MPPRGQGAHYRRGVYGGRCGLFICGAQRDFYDRQGQDWDATITTLIDNPTSIGQAFFSPYKKFLRFVEAQVAQRAASKDAAVTEGLQAKAAHLAGAAPTPAEAPAPSKTDVGTVAAIGVALGSSLRVDRALAAAKTAHAHRCWKLSQFHHRP